MKKVNVSDQAFKDLKEMRRCFGFGTYSQTIAYLIKYYKDSVIKQDREFNQKIKEVFDL